MGYISALSEDHVKAHYKLVTDNALPSVNPNVFMAALTSCHARLRFYQALHHLQEHMLYFNIDKVICLHQRNDPPLYPLRGNYLGDFKDVQVTTLLNSAQAD